MAVGESSRQSHEAEGPTHQAGAHDCSNDMLYVMGMTAYPIGTPKPQAVAFQTYARRPNGLSVSLSLPQCVHAESCNQASLLLQRRGRPGCSGACLFWALHLVSAVDLGAQCPPLALSPIGSGRRVSTAPNRERAFSSKDDPKREAWLSLSAESSRAKRSSGDDCSPSNRFCRVREAVLPKLQGPFQGNKAIVWNRVPAEESPEGQSSIAWPRPKPRSRDGDWSGSEGERSGHKVKDDLKTQETESAQTMQRIS